jgi:HPt (histidine-containing phosphotransfer) domain-containing protein
MAAAHELKGSSANAGTAEIAQIAADLDKHLRAGNADIAQFVTRLHQAHGRAVSAARSMECEA